LLTADLAAAAGIDLKPPQKLPSLRLPRPHLPRLRMPRMQFSAPRMPKVNWPKRNLRRPQQPRRIDAPAIEPAVASEARGRDAGAGTAEDRALAVAGVLVDIWAAADLTSPILGIDTASTAGNGKVIVTIDAHPDEEQRIGDLPERIVAQRPAWRASWRRSGGS